MKKILLLLSLITTSIFALSQNPDFPNMQPQGSPTTKWVQQGAVKGVKGIINGVYPDTATANLGYIDANAGAQIVTTTPSLEFWIRSSDAKKWIKVSLGITSFTFVDSSMVICYGTGVCDTFSIANFSSTINNLVINNNTTISIYNNSLVICSGSGATIHCDTLSLAIDSINNYYFLDDSTAVACDTPRVTQIGDSFVVQQLCDTIRVPRGARLVLQNGLQFVAPGIGEFGSSYPEPNPSQLQKDTYLYTDFYNFGVYGAPYQRPVLSVQNKQWSSISSSVASFSHLGNNIYFNPSAIDNNNSVNLYVNYINKAFEGNGVFAGDTISQMFDRIGYALMTNSQGIRSGYHVNNSLSKQVGVLFHTLDTGNNDAITLFGSQTPINYLFSVSPYPTQTLLDKRIAVFKTTKEVQFLGYPNSRDDGSSPDGKGFYADADGNILYGQIGSAASITSANNGASVSSGVVQLGQSVSAIGNPAALLSNREIPMANFTLNFKADAAQTNNLVDFKNTSAVVRARITSAAAFSNTGGQTGSEIFGDGASVTGVNSVAVGKSSVAPEQSVVIGESSSSTSTGSDVVIGKSAVNSSSNPGSVLIGSNTSSTGTGGGNVLIGTSTSSTGSQLVAVGYSAAGTGSNSITVGANAGAAHTYSQVYGFGAVSTAANQLVYGSSNSSYGGIDDAYFGRGVTSTVANNFTMQPTGASGTNMAGNSFTIAASKATGNAAGGSIYFATSNAGASGSSLQSLTNKAVMYYTGVFGIGKFSSFGASRLHVEDAALTTDNVKVVSTVTSTGSSQHGINSVISGTLTSGSQTVVAVRGENSVNTSGVGGPNYAGEFVTTGAGSINYGAYGSASGGTVYSVGVYGTASGSALFNAGVYGDCAVASGYGVLGVAGSSSSGVGVSGQNNTGGGTGVSGTVSGSASANAIAVSGIASITTGNATGVYGGATGVSSGTNTGGFFEGRNGGTNYAIIVPSGGGNVGIGTGTPSSSALLELSSTTQGFIVMRMTATQASAITAAAGMMVFVIDTNGTFTSVGFWGYDGSAWAKF